MDPTTVLLLALAVALVALPIALWRLWLRWRHRRRLWESAALELGLEFEPGLALHERHGELGFFRQGRRRVTRIALRGRRQEALVHLADYQYTTGGGQHSHTHDQTVCVLQAHGMALPAFSLRRERALLDAVRAAFGGQDLDFADDEAFSRAFVLRGEEEEAVRRLFDFEARQALLPLRDRRAFLEGRRDVLLYHTGRLIDPATARDVIEEALDVLRILRRSAARRR